ncbi:hypothetical protein [Kutzneria sp. 744]|uniref:hypothetical protein n=1 Tax=Kutzneria sp. (strain 744) TaxID=345341 RepID=UPI0003EED554|nr:hypothetical protein [Kutzneria sp. 744]EWM17532.1 hypothetical protein KUTG_07836 [Kutzneria sp. 744]
MKFMLTAAASLALMAGGLGAGVAQAEAAPGCSSTVQIGSTAYASYEGQTIASVKQFKGCGKNWAYTYVWDQFRAKNLDYYIVTFVDSSATDVGFRTSTKNARELWSGGTDTLALCTRAAGAVYLGSKAYDAVETDERC